MTSSRTTSASWWCRPTGVLCAGQLAGADPAGARRDREHRAAGAGRNAPHAGRTAQRRRRPGRAAAAWHRPARRAARPDPGQRAGCLVHRAGGARPLPSGLALAAYRIIQESLTNTRKHGGPGASATVLLHYCEDVLMLQITDDGRGATVADGAGHGLTGMRERSRCTTARCAPARCPAAATRSPRPSRSAPFAWPIRPRPPRPPRTRSRLPTCPGRPRERAQRRLSAPRRRGGSTT